MESFCTRSLTAYQKQRHGRDMQYIHNRCPITIYGDPSTTSLFHVIIATRKMMISEQVVGKLWKMYEAL